MNAAGSPLSQPAEDPNDTIPTWWFIRFAPSEIMRNGKCIKNIRWVMVSDIEMI